MLLTVAWFWLWPDYPAQILAMEDPEYTPEVFHLVAEQPGNFQGDPLGWYALDYTKASAVYFLPQMLADFMNPQMVGKFWVWFQWAATPLVLFWICLQSGLRREIGWWAALLGLWGAPMCWTWAGAGHVLQQPYPAGVAYPLALAGVFCFWRGFRWISFLLLGLTVWIHVATAFYATALCGALELGSERGRRLLDRSSVLWFVGLAGMFVWYYLGVVRGSDGVVAPLSHAEILQGLRMYWHFFPWWEEPALWKTKLTDGFLATGLLMAGTAWAAGRRQLSGEPSFPWIPLAGFVVISVLLGFLVQMLGWVNGIRLMPFRAAGLAWGLAWPFLLAELIRSVRQDRLSAAGVAACMVLLTFPFVSQSTWGRYVFLGASAVWLWGQFASGGHFRSRAGQPVMLGCLSLGFALLGVVYWLAPENWISGLARWFGRDPFWTGMLIENLSMERQNLWQKGSGWLGVAAAILPAWLCLGWSSVNPNLRAALVAAVGAGMVITGLTADRSAALSASARGNQIAEAARLVRLVCPPDAVFLEGPGQWRLASGHSMRPVIPSYFYVYFGSRKILEYEKKALQAAGLHLPKNYVSRFRMEKQWREALGGMPAEGYIDLAGRLGAGWTVRARNRPVPGLVPAAEAGGFLIYRLPPPAALEQNFSS